MNASQKGKRKKGPVRFEPAFSRCCAGALTLVWQLLPWQNCLNVLAWSMFSILTCSHANPYGAVMAEGLPVVLNGPCRNLINRWGHDCHPPNNDSNTRLTKLETIKATETKQQQRNNWNKMIQRVGFHLKRGNQGSVKFCEPMPIKLAK